MKKPNKPSHPTGISFGVTFHGFPFPPADGQRRSLEIMKIWLILLIPVLTACDSGRTFVSPASSEVTTITAELFKRWDTGAHIDRFVVPQASYKPILTSLNGAHRDNFGMKWMVLGDIDITLATGSVHVRLFWTRKDTGAFKVNGTYYRAASDLEFLRLIEAAKQQSEQAVSSDGHKPSSSESSAGPTAPADAH